MRGGITALVLIDLAFVLLLSVSGADGFFGVALYLLAFVLPIAAGLLFASKNGDASTVSVKKERILPSIALFAPTLLVTIGISAVSTYLLTLLGKNNVTDVSGDLWLSLLRHALLPAVLEEMLFRFIPLRLLGKRSPRAVILVSPILFALIHLNLFQIPYALFAGGVLTFITISTGSVLPAMLLHLANNAMSVIWMRNPELAMPIIISVSLLCAVSLVYIFIRRKEYAGWAKEAFSGERVGFYPELAVAVVILLAAAILNLR